MKSFLGCKDLSREVETLDPDSIRKKKTKKKKKKPDMMQEERYACRAQKEHSSGIKGKNK